MGIDRMLFLTTHYSFRHVTKIFFSVQAAIEKSCSINLGKDAKEFKAPDGIMFQVEQRGRLDYL